MRKIKSTFFAGDVTLLIRTLLFLYFTLFTYELSFAQWNQLPYSNYVQVREGIINFIFQTTKGSTTVAFLGGSITHNPGWRDSVCQYLQAKFPQTHFRFINAGIPSLGSLPDVFRVQQDVLDSGKIDLLFVEAAVNDRVNETDSITQIRSLEGIVRHARKENPNIGIVLMPFADPEKIKDYDEGKIPVEVRNHELVASHYHLPSINLARAVYDKIRAGEFSWEKDFKDVHPSPFGQRIYFNTIRELLEESFVQSVVRMAKEVSYSLPEPLDKWNFENGKYLPIQKAKLKQGWKLSENWQPKDKSTGTRKGFVNRPMLEAVTPGASLSLTFKGTAVGMAVISGPDAGKVEYSIDNGIYQTIDLYTQWSSFLHLPWYVLFAGDLKNKKHTIKIRMATQKNPQSKGTACRIVYFLVNDVALQPVF